MTEQLQYAKVISAYTAYRTAKARWQNIRDRYSEIYMKCRDNDFTENENPREFFAAMNGAIIVMDSAWRTYMDYEHELNMALEKFPNAS